MEIAKSDIVRSDAGRDRGKLFIVLAVEGEYLLLADGKGRRVEAPKRKKRRHVLFVAAEPVKAYIFSATIFPKTPRPGIRSSCLSSAARTAVRSTDLAAPIP